MDCMELSFILTYINKTRVRLSPIIFRLVYVLLCIMEESHIFIGLINWFVLLFRVEHTMIRTKMMEHPQKKIECYIMILFQEEWVAFTEVKIFWSNKR